MALISSRDAMRFPPRLSSSSVVMPASAEAAGDAVIVELELPESGKGGETLEGGDAAADHAQLLEGDALLEADHVGARAHGVEGERGDRLRIVAVGFAHVDDGLRGKGVGEREIANRDGEGEEQTATRGARGSVSGAHLLHRVGSSGRRGREVEMRKEEQRLFFCSVGGFRGRRTRESVGVRREEGARVRARRTRAGAKCSGSARGFVTRDSWIARARRSKRHPPRFHRVEKNARPAERWTPKTTCGSWVTCTKYRLDTLCLSARSADNICRASFSNFFAAPARDWPTLVGTGRAFPISPPPATVRFLDSKLLREGSEE